MKLYIHWTILDFSLFPATDNHQSTLHFYLFFLLFQIPQISEIMKYLPFCDRSILLFIMSSRFTHVKNGRVSFFF